MAVEGRQLRGQRTREFIALRKIKVTDNFEFIIRPLGERLLNNLGYVVLEREPRHLVGRQLASIEAKVLKRRLPQRVHVRKYSSEGHGGRGTHRAVKLVFDDLQLLRLGVDVELHAIGFARARVRGYDMVPAPLDQNPLFCLDRNGVLRRLMGKRKFKLALADAKLPAPRVLFGIGTCQDHAVGLFLVFGFERPQVRTQPEGHGEWLISFNVAPLRQIQPGGCVHPHVRPEPYSLAPDHRTSSG